MKRIKIGAFNTANKPGTYPHMHAWVKCMHSRFVYLCTYLLGFVPGGIGIIGLGGWFRELRVKSVALSERLLVFPSNNRIWWLMTSEMISKHLLYISIFKLDFTK